MYYIAFTGIQLMELLYVADDARIRAKWHVYCAIQFSRLNIIILSYNDQSELQCMYNYNYI